MFKNVILPILKCAGYSFSEVLVVCIFGIAPLFAVALRASEQTNAVDSIASSITRGQLFLYAFSLIGTLAWLSIANWRIPSGVIKSIIALFVLVMIMLIFSFGIFDPTFEELKNENSVIWSYIIYFYAIFLYFAILMVINFPSIELGGVFRRGASSLIGKAGGKERLDGEERR